MCLLFLAQQPLPEQPPAPRLKLVRVALDEPVWTCAVCEGAIIHNPIGLGTTPALAYANWLRALGQR